MTFYFLFSLLLSLILVAGLFLLLINRLQVNWTGRNKRGISFLLPVGIVILFFFTVGLDTYPRLLDTVNAIQKNFKTIEISGENINTQNNKYIIFDEIYLASPSEEAIVNDETYSLSYLPNTKIIIRQEKVETLPSVEQEPTQIEKISPGD